MSAEARPVILCAAPDCQKAAGPEGFCADHPEEAKAARERSKALVEMGRQAEAMQRVRALARKVVNVERRDRWRKTTKAEKRRAKVKARSQRKNR